MGSEFMPMMDEGSLLYMPTALPGLASGKAAQLLQQTDRLIKTVPEVQSVFGKAGRALTATDPAPTEMFETIIQLKPKDEWREGVTMESLRLEMDAALQFPGVSNAWTMPIKARIDMLTTGVRTPIGIKVLGPDLTVTDETIVGLIDGHPFGEWRPQGRILPLAQARLVAPVLPSKVIGIGRNYAEHVAEMGGAQAQPPASPRRAMRRQSPSRVTSLDSSQSRARSTESSSAAVPESWMAMAARQVQHEQSAPWIGLPSTSEVMSR